MTDSKTARINVSAYVNNFCPPCEYFTPELADSSIAWVGSKCVRSDYAIDCSHRKVCGLGHEWRQIHDR